VVTSRASIAYLVAHTIGGFEEFTPPAVPTYSDVPIDHFMYAEIEYASYREIMRGYDDGCFYPEFDVTRDQGAVYVAREDAGGGGNVPPGPPTPSFPDVPVAYWAYDYIEYDLAQGIFAGTEYPDGLFHPDHLLDLYDAAIWFQNASGVYVDPATIPPGGTVAGSIVERYSGVPIGGATVIVCDGGSHYYSRTTALDGTYSISAVAAGPSYTVCASANGYFPTAGSGMAVAPNEHCNVSLALLRDGTWFEDDDPVISYSGMWNSYNHPAASAGHLKYSPQAGASAYFPFYGTGVKWQVAKGPRMGKARIYLDNTLVGLVDLYSPSPKLLTLSKTGLLRGERILRIEVSGLRNPRSSGYVVDIDAFEVVP
jgi:hypothetical protein